MNKYLKIIAAVTLYSCCLSTMAAEKFIVKYKLTEDQKTNLQRSNPNISTQEFKALIAEELMKKLSTEQLAALSAAATKAKGKTSEPIEVMDLRPVGGGGAHVILLGEDLDKSQTERFIEEVKKIDLIENIEENAWVYSC